MAPRQKPHRSEQVVCTPPEFLYAVRERLGIAQFDCDLAASIDNTICSMFYTEEDSALLHNWSLGEDWNWCNPPYGSIAPWVQKAWEEAGRGAKTAMLVPASVGSNWWKNWVHNAAHVLFLNGRLTFVGHKTCYPKDLALLLYCKSHVGGYEVWPWENE